MRKVYDEFIQQKPKEMSKTLEDIAFKYINPETQKPTKVPAAHFEKELGQEIERAIAQGTSRKFLSIMFTELSNLKKEDEKYFYQALLCIDNNLNPKDLRISDQISLDYAYNFIVEKQRTEKKEFRFLDQEISREYDKAKTDSSIQAEAMELSNFLENQETRELNRIEEQDNTNQEIQNQTSESLENDEDIDMDYEY